MAERDDLYREGVSLMKEKQYEPALAKFEEAAKDADASYTYPFHAMVQCYTELARHEEAINTARKIVDFEPDDQFSYIALSRAYQRAGMIPEAEYAMMQGQQASFRAQAAKANK